MGVCGYREIGRVSSDDQKRVCSYWTRFQHEHISKEFNRPTREWAKRVSEWVEWAVRANKRSEGPNGPLYTRLSVTRNAPPLFPFPHFEVLLSSKPFLSPLSNSIILHWQKVEKVKWFHLAWVSPPFHCSPVFMEWQTDRRNGGDWSLRLLHTDTWNYSASKIRRELVKLLS